MNIADQTIKEYVNDVFSAKPVPGGGSAAALIGSQGAALAGMLTKLTTAKKIFQSFEPDVQEEFMRLEKFFGEQKDRLLALSSDDVKAFADVLAAIRLPRDSEAEATERRVRMQAAQTHATLVPLETARTALETLRKMKPVIARGNVNAISDGAIGALCLDLAVQGGVYNVRINLPGLSDADLVEELRAECGTLIAESDALKSELIANVDTRLG